jgi:hypothetical protein
MNELVMFRAPRESLMDRRAYEFFAGRRATGAAAWTADMDRRAVVHTFPRGWVNRTVHPWSWIPSVAYNPGLGQYMMVNWGTSSASDGSWFGRPSYLGPWVAPKPWGPWEQVHEETSWTPAADSAARCYQPQIAPKWIAPDGRSFWLIWSDFQGEGPPL